MRLHTLAAAAVVLAALAAPPPASAAACAPPPAARVVVETKEAAVTVERQNEGRDPFDGGSSAVWRGCARETGTQVELQTGFSEYFSYRHASRFELAGPFAAFLINSADNKYESFERLAVVDLRTGGRWETVPIVSSFDEHAVNRRGDLAWIRPAYSRAARRREWRLHVRRDGAVTLRATSSEPLTGLRLTPTRLVWRERGRRRSLPLG